jgi:hypothetical protein
LGCGVHLTVKRLLALVMFGLQKTTAAILAASNLLVHLKSTDK